MSQLILLRHGESEFNKLNLFTGWLDVGLSSNGVTEAILAGKTLQETNIDYIFTSTLIRAEQTAMLLMTVKPNKPPIIVTKTEHNQKPKTTEITADIAEKCTPVISDWRLNERHYGKLQGLNKKAAAEKYGKEQVALWRRGFDATPPGGESLAMTMERTIPAMKELILPKLMQDKTILVVAHGNSLRSIIMHIDNIAPQDIQNLEIATAQPMAYEFDIRNNCFSKI
jgi:2,3-bisphosphoglycerate-dependent phosphoglycerate mutase